MGRGPFSAERARRVAKMVREVNALLTQARYLSLDLPTTALFGRGPTVVLVHGLYASAGVFRPLRNRLSSELDASTYSFSYVPGPGICELSERLRDLVCQVSSAAPIILLGHSLGGLVIRHYLGQGTPDPRIVQSISLAAPFLGSPKSHLVPGQAGKDISLGAPILEPLRRASAQNLAVPHLSLLGADDELIVPRAIPEYGDSEVFDGVGHNGILFDARVAECCLGVVAEVGARGSRR